MFTIRDPSDVSGLSHPGIAHIASQRISQLRLSAEEALPDIGKFIIVESGDAMGEIEEASGCCITTDFFGEAHYRHPDFVPSFDWLEHHVGQQCFELVFITTDDFFTVLLIPDDPGIDPDLLSLCRDYS